MCPLYKEDLSQANGANVLVRGQLHKVGSEDTFSKLCQIVNMNAFYNIA